MGTIQILAAFTGGYLYCLLGFMVIAWASDRSPWVDRRLRDGSTTMNTLVLFVFMASWPAVLMAALPGILARARMRRKPAI
jgi:hypothetical protein